MHSRPQTQLLLQLDREDRRRPVASAPSELVQALADLLLETLGNYTPLATPGQEASDEPQDHA